MEREMHTLDAAMAAALFNGAEEDRPVAPHDLLREGTRSMVRLALIVATVGLFVLTLEAAIWAMAPNGAPQVAIERLD
jgi:hypothetical protein